MTTLETMRRKIRSLAKAWIQDPELIPAAALARIALARAGAVGSSTYRKALWHAAAELTIGGLFDFEVCYVGRDGTLDLFDVMIGKPRLSTAQAAAAILRERRCIRCGGDWGFFERCPHCGHEVRR